MLLLSWPQGCMNTCNKIFDVYGMLLGGCKNTRLRDGSTCVKWAPAWLNISSHMRTISHNRYLNPEHPQRQTEAKGHADRDSGQGQNSSQRLTPSLSHTQGPAQGGPYPCGFGPLRDRHPCCICRFSLHKCNQHNVSKPWQDIRVVEWGPTSVERYP